MWSQKWHGNQQLILEGKNQGARQPLCDRCHPRGDRTARAPSGKRLEASAPGVEKSIRGFGFHDSAQPPAKWHRDGGGRRVAPEVSGYRSVGVAAGPSLTPPCKSSTTNADSRDASAREGGCGRGSRARGDSLASRCDERTTPLSTSMRRHRWI
jgi:hypothetical protein